MMIPDDVGVTAFHGEAKLKATLLERLEWYEAQGDAGLKRAMLQEEWSSRAQRGLVFNPYPKIVQAEDTAGLRISGDVATLYALGAVNRSQLGLVSERLYLIRSSGEDAFNKRLGVPITLVSILKAIGGGLPPERKTSWLRQFWAAVPVGASLWRVPMRMVLWALSDLSYGILGLSEAAAEDNTGIKAVRDVLGLYRNWLAGDKAASPDWFPFYTRLEDSAKSGRRLGDDGEYVYDLPAPERYCLRAAACAARAASVEASVTTPLPAGTIKLQIPVTDLLNAPGNAVTQAGLYASEKGIVPGVWYEACASAALNILADCPVPDRPSE